MLYIPIKRLKYATLYSVLPYLETSHAHEIWYPAFPGVGQLIFEETFLFREPLQILYFSKRC